RAEARRGRDLESECHEVTGEREADDGEKRGAKGHSFAVSYLTWRATQTSTGATPPPWRCPTAPTQARSSRGAAATSPRTSRRTCPPIGRPSSARSDA